MVESLSKKGLVWFFVCVLTPINIFLSYEYFTQSFATQNHSEMELTPIPVKFFSKPETGVNVQSHNDAVTEVRCVLPKLNPFDPVVLDETSEIPIKVVCNVEDYPLIFKTDLESNLIVVNCPCQFALESCCYKKLIPNEKYVDGNPSYSKDCVYLRNTTTKIPSDIESIGLFCKKIPESTTPKPTPKPTSKPTSKPASKWTSKPSSKPKTTAVDDPLKIVDILTFTRLKPEVEKRIEKMTNIPKDSDAFSVVILGLDSISHMHFLRTMPKTHKYITEDLSGVGMNGYVSIGDNTRPNIFVALTGHTVEELLKICSNNTELEMKTAFDTCPLVWKNFSAQGYRTSYGEDADKMTMFNYNTAGFYHAPTDYYLHTLMRAQRIAIPHRWDLNAAMCHGPRLVLDILLEHMLDLATLMEKRKYFQFIWSNSMTHDFLNFPKLIDDNVYLAIKQMKERGQLDNKVFIFMSDHGHRWADFGDTYHGQMEARMPFFYIVLPEAFTKRYPEMAANLKINSNRLTSPFDLYETLLQLSTLASVDNEFNNRRFYMKWLQPAQTKNLTSVRSNGRGISLFEAIPMNRTCKSAGIPDHYCVCHNMTKIPTIGSDVAEAAKSFVQSINSKLTNFTDCANLSLVNVSEAYNLLHWAAETKKNEIRIRLFVETVPGNAKFEVTMSRSPIGVWSPVSDNRVNLYKDTSHCVTDPKIKNYCYCLKQPRTV